MSTDGGATAAERKRKRLEAWRKKQQANQAPAPAPTVKVSLSLGAAAATRKRNTKKRSLVPTKSTVRNPLLADEETEQSAKRKRGSRAMGFELDNDVDDDDDDHRNDTWGEANETTTEQPPSSTKRRRKKRWDDKAVGSATAATSPTTKTKADIDDALDTFMDKLQAGTMGSVATQDSAVNVSLSIDVSGSMMRTSKASSSLSKPTTPVSGGVITSEQLEQLGGGGKGKDAALAGALYTHSDWESDAHAGGASGASEPETDDDEETARRAFIEALKSAPVPAATNTESEQQSAVGRPAQLAAEVKSEKHRREERLKQLEREAEVARQSAAAAAAPDFGRLYNDLEGGVMEEAERNLDAANAAPDALEVLAELNKKKELKAVDHSKIDYISFKKNLYLVPRSVASLSADDIADRRAKLKVKVRGKGAPAPVLTFEECGLSEKILKIMEKQDITVPYPVQAQCLPCIMAGRDVIGIAKTGSGKTLAYLLPMLRHIADQPDLEPNESGPIGLILAPARELAAQIQSVCKVFAKNLGLKFATHTLWTKLAFTFHFFISSTSMLLICARFFSLLVCCTPRLFSLCRSTAVYGGAAVAEQIADLKRGTHIVVATPGRLIDILTMQSGKILSMQRVSYVVLDEADRMFDMGFAPQINAILSAVRPDRQIVLFSATFPKAVEALAKKSLKYPVEVIVGGRSVASDNISQYAELVEEEDKFLRLLQLLGEHVDDEKKVLVFVDTQVKADSLYEQLMRCGYPSLSLHGGKEQEDRDSTISDFKRKDGPSVMVATGVAGRGLDVASCACVINFSSPNHLEAYVHQVGRTGRAGRKGVGFTFVNSTDESKFAPIVVRALSEAGQSEHIATELKELSDSFKEKVKKGEAKYAGSGFKGKGYSYDSNELSEAQKLARLEKRQALIEAGMLDPEEEETTIKELTESSSGSAAASSDKPTENAAEPDYAAAAELQTKLSPALLALPGMQQAIMKKTGIMQDAGDEDDPSLGRPVQTGTNHFVQEFEINDYPREARWKVTQKDTTSRLQDEFQTAVTLKGEYFGSDREPGEGQRKLYLHLEATSERVLGNCVVEIRRLLNEETLRVGARGLSGSSHKYSVFSK